jgi:hypothetical protein
MKPNPAVAPVIKIFFPSRENNSWIDGTFIGSAS